MLFEKYVTELMRHPVYQIISVAVHCSAFMSNR